MLEVSNEKFSGPLGLLLSLIEKEEMDITEISLAKIADDYINYIRANQEIEPEEMADFLVIAAKLLFIKSKALLPYLYNKEDQEEVSDLENQLKMYKEFIDASLKLKEILSLNRRLYLAPISKGSRLQTKVLSFSPPAKLTANILKDKFAELLLNLEKELAKKDQEKLKVESLEPKISIDEKIFSIRQMLAEKVKINFSRLLSTAKNKTEIIVSFLAVLELAKQKELYFQQEGLFSEITINLNNFNQESEEIKNNENN